MKKAPNYSYRCPHCRAMVRRSGPPVMHRNGRPKQWSKSLCEKTGQPVRLQLLPLDEVTRTVRSLKRRGLWPS